MFWHDDHFQVFANALETAMEQYKEPPIQPHEDGFLELQQKQVESLIELEEKWKQTLLEHPLGPSMYEAFVKYVRGTLGNILSARPYFRERQSYFAEHIAPALKGWDVEGLYPHRINASFISWTLKQAPWPSTSPIVQIADEIFKLRNEIVEINMPLAISRARIFGNRTSKDHLSQMDLVQLAAEGLLIAINKFVPPFSRVFRSVAIGRMVSLFIQNYSDNLVHFYPSDRRKIYRARKVLSIHGDMDMSQLVCRVNEGVDDQNRGGITTESELWQLLSGSDLTSIEVVVSAGVPDGGEEGGATFFDCFAAPETDHPDQVYEQAEAFGALCRAIEQLSVYEQKLLRLKGVDIDQMKSLVDQMELQQKE